MNNFKKLSNEEYCEKFYAFLKDKTQNNIALFDTTFSENRLYGDLYSKVDHGDFIVIFSTAVVLKDNDFINDITESRSELKYSGVYVKKVDKLFDVPYKIIVNSKENNYHWLGKGLETIKEQFNKNCLQTIFDELQTTYKTANDIPDSFINQPITEEEIENSDWKECYTKNQPFEFKPIIRHEISNKKILNYILDTQKEMENFEKEFKTTEQYFGLIRYLKKYYLINEKINNHKPDEKEQIKKELYEALIPLKSYVKTVKLYIMGKDKNKNRRYEESIEGQIIEVSYPIDMLINALIYGNYISTYKATNWSIKTGKRNSQKPIKEIYAEDITKITSNRTVIYEK